MRLPPPDRSSLEPEIDELLHLAAAPSGETAETIAVLAHSPALVEPFLSWAMALHSHGVISPRLHEVVALRVAERCGSSYEWDEHVLWARAAGLDDAEIDAARTGPEAWPEPESTVVAAVDDLHDHQQLSDEVLASLRGQLGDAAVVEIVMVAGQYTMLSMLANTTGTPRAEPSGG